MMGKIFNETQYKNFDLDYYSNYKKIQPFHKVSPRGEEKSLRKIDPYVFGEKWRRYCVDIDIEIFIGIFEVEIKILLLKAF